jgi:broad specificity phosphatase PhoE
MAGVISPQGMPSWDEFAGGVRAALDHVRHQHAGHNVLLVSSGGPISPPPWARCWAPRPR